VTSAAGALEGSEADSYSKAEKDVPFPRMAFAGISRQNRLPRCHQNGHCESGRPDQCPVRAPDQHVYMG